MFDSFQHLPMLNIKQTVTLNQLIFSSERKNKLLSLIAKLKCLLRQELFAV